MDSGNQILIKKSCRNFFISSRGFIWFLDNSYLIPLGCSLVPNYDWHSNSNSVHIPLALFDSSLKLPSPYYSLKDKCQHRFIQNNTFHLPVNIVFCFSVSFCRLLESTFWQKRSLWFILFLQYLCKGNQKCKSATRNIFQSLKVWQQRFKSVLTRPWVELCSDLCECLCVCMWRHVDVIYIELSSGIPPAERTDIYSPFLSCTLSCLSSFSFSLFFFLTSILFYALRSCSVSCWRHKLHLQEPL